jgi:glycosylphosphatidylinositol phospholipase D
MIHLVPFKDIPNAAQTAKAFINSIYRLHGLPYDIITDRGTQFTSDLWQEFLLILGVQSKIATTDHHETVGQVERCNSYIEQYLRCFSRSFYHNDWADFLPLAEFAYNNSIHPSTNETPFFVNYGFHPYMDEFTLLPTTNINHKTIQKVAEGFNHIQDVLLRSQELYKRASDKKRMTAPTYKIDDLVWIQAPPSLNLESSSKLAPCKYGPYKVTNVLHNNNYEIDLKKSPFPKHYNVFHVSELEPFIPVPTRFSKRNIDPESIKDIVEISGFRTNYKKKQYEYRVRYKYRTAYNWVPSSEVEDNPRNQRIFMEYLNSNRTSASISYDN